MSFVLSCICFFITSAKLIFSSFFHTFFSSVSLESLQTYQFFFWIILYFSLKIFKLEFIIYTFFLEDFIFFFILPNSFFIILAYVMCSYSRNILFISLFFFLFAHFVIIPSSSSFINLTLPSTFTNPLVPLFSFSNPEKSSVLFEPANLISLNGISKT